MAENPEETAESIIEGVASAGAPGRGDEPSEAVPATPAAGASEEAPARARSATRPRAAPRRPSRRGPRTLEDRIADRKAHRERNARQRRAYRAKLKTKRAEARAAAPVVEVQRASEHGSGKPKVRQGVVISDKGDKTITSASTSRGATSATTRSCATR